MRVLILFPIASLFFNALAATIPGDAKRGGELFESQKCVVCHSLNGQGGKGAPDLAKRTARAYTPGVMASLMWNHAPAMWSAFARESIEKPQLNEQQAADLFAYFYAFRYFEQPGDAGRGKALFTSKGCSGCHGISDVRAGGGPPVAQWDALADPLDLARAMWNHAARMTAAVESKKLAWPKLTAQELTDMMVYLKNLPQTRATSPQFSLGSSDTGEMLFKAKGCADCHRGNMAFDQKFRRRSLTDFAAAMWNHSPKMLQVGQALRPEEMRRLVGYLWSTQYFDHPGNTVAGKKVFEKKRCVSCHGVAGSGAPDLASRKEQRNGISMSVVLWKHGPGMLEQMNQKKIEWPRFRGTEFDDLMAYLNSLH